MNKNAVREEIDSVKVLQRGVKALLAQQNEQGYWEGEVVWCPMLPAQYVLMCYITQTPIAPQRKQAIALISHLILN